MRRPLSSSLARSNAQSVPCQVSGLLLRLILLLTDLYVLIFLLKLIVNTLHIITGFILISSVFQTCRNITVIIVIHI